MEIISQSDKNSVNQSFTKWIQEKQLQDEAIKIIIQKLNAKNQFLSNPSLRPVRPITKITELDDLGMIEDQIKTEILLKGYVLNTHSFTLRFEQQKYAVYKLNKLLAKDKLVLSTIGDPVLRMFSEKGPVVIPLDCREACIKAVHLSPGTFHLGAPRTTTVCLDYFYFPAMHEMIEKYVKSCDACLRGKRRPHRIKPDLGKTSSNSHRRLHIWSIDVIAMPPGKGGYTGILAMVDCATSYIEAFPIKKSNAATIGKILREKMCSRYGYGLIFTTDRAKEMIAAEVKKAVKDFGSEFYETTSYHSNSNPIERFNLIIGQIIRVKLIHHGWRKEAWPDCLSETILTMNLAPDSQTKQSAYLRVFGQTPITKCSIWFGQVPDDKIHAINQELDPWKPDVQEDIDETVIVEENADQLTLEVKKAGEKEPVIKQFDKYRAEDDEEEVSYHQIGYVQQQAQRIKNKAAEKRHQVNQRSWKKNQVGIYDPIIGEIVDFKSKNDPNSPFSRKLKEEWIGPFKIISRDKPLTAIIRPFDKDKKKVYGEARRVYLGDIRISTIFTNHHETFIPPWFPFHKENSNVQLISVVEEAEVEMDWRAKKDGPEEILMETEVDVEDIDVMEQRMIDDIDNDFIVVQPVHAISECKYAAQIEEVEEEKLESLPDSSDIEREVVTLFNAQVEHQLSFEQA